MSPCVSVIIPAYNAEKVVGQTLQMMRDQTFSDFEVIVVDDGSTDSTAHIVEGFCESDPRFVLIRQENAGAAAARNAGLAAARGTFVCFLDADDVYDARLLGHMVGAISASGADMCVCEADIYHMETGESHPLFRFSEGVKGGLHERAEFGRRLFQSFNKTPWNKLYRADFLKRTQILFQSLPNMNDAFFVECNLALALNIYTLKETLVSYRRGLGTSLQDTRNKYPACALEAAAAIFDELIGRHTLSADELISLKNECWRLAITAQETALTTKDFDTVDEILCEVRRLAQVWELDELTRTDFILIEYWLWYVCFMRVSTKGLMWAYNIKRKPINEKQTMLTNVRTALRLTLATVVSPDRNQKKAKRGSKVPAAETSASPA